MSKKPYPIQTLQACGQSSFNQLAFKAGKNSAHIMFMGPNNTHDDAEVIVNILHSTSDNIYQIKDHKRFIRLQNFTFAAIKSGNIELAQYYAYVTAKYFNNEVRRLREVA